MAIKINPYTNEYIQYSLTYDEIKIIDNIWILIMMLRHSKFTKIQYRMYIKHNIKHNYDIDTFYKYEYIIEKLYWNLAFVMKKILSDIDIHNAYHKVSVKSKQDIELHTNMIMKRNPLLTEGTKHKFIIYDDKDKLLMYKTVYPNSFDIIVSSVMTDRSIYETIMSDPKNITIEKINTMILNYYDNPIEFDYGYPNLNTIAPYIQSKKTKYDNIYNSFYA